MNKLFTLLILSMLSGVFAAQPIYEWNFDHWKNNRSRALKQNININGKIAQNSGIDGSNGLLCNNKTRNHFAMINLDWKAFTIELQFKLDHPFDGKKSRTLVCYETNSWNRQRLLLQIKGNGKLVADFRISTPKALRFQIESVPQKWETGKFYTVRLAGVSGGTMKLYLDNQLLAAKESALALADLKMPQKVAWYPIFSLGFDHANPSQIAAPLHGVIDNLKLWNTFEEPELLADNALGEVSPHLVLNGEWSTPFKVLDKEQGVAGNLVMAADKFVKNAGRVAAELSGDKLLVTFRCPIPAGMKIKTGASVWAGDVVEFFFNPTPSQSGYFHYAASPSGAKFAQKCTGPLAPIKGFTSQFTVKCTNTPTEFTIEMAIPLTELGIKANQAGTAFAGNFTRSGHTAGGLSTWAPMGESFHNPDGFKPLIVGNRRAYFARRLDLEKAQAAKYQVDLSKLQNAIQIHGNQGAWFDRINAAFAALKVEMVQKSFKDKRQLIYAADLWGNSLNFNLLTKPLQKIKIVMPQNSLYYTGFAIANLTDQSFLGQIKCFPKKPYQSKGTKFNSEPFNQLCRQIQFMEGIKSWNISHQAHYDAIAPLTLNTMLRIAPHASLPLWLEISTANIPVGTHHAVIALKDGTGHPSMTMVELELEIKPVDLAKIKIDTFYYTYLQQSKSFGYQPIQNFFGRHEANYVFCVPGQLDVYPNQNADGSIQKMDFKELDQMLDSAIQGGIARDQLKLNLHLALNQGYGMRRPGKTGHPSRFARFTPQWQRGMKESLQAIQRHLKDKYDITPDRVVLYPIDEPNGDIDNPKSSMYEALRYCKLLKQWVPQMRVMVNPHPHKLDEVRSKAFVKLAPYVDIFELYRPNASENAELVKLIKSLKKEVWTYSIANMATHPANYRLDYWRNMADNFSSIATYWHLEDMAGGDGFDPTDTSWGSKNRTDYGTVYADFNYGTIIPGRRFIAGRLGQEERKIYEYCRQKITNSPRRIELQKELNQIIAQGANSTMDQLEKIRVKLLYFAAKL